MKVASESRKVNAINHTCSNCSNYAMKRTGALSISHLRTLMDALTISLSILGRTGGGRTGRTVRIVHLSPFKTCTCDGKAKQKEIGVHYFLESCVHLGRCDILLSGRDFTSYIHKILGRSREETPAWGHSSFGFRNPDENYYTHMFAVVLDVHMNTNSSECCREMPSVMMRRRTQHDDVAPPGFNTI
jgi:hypothetical protein